ncbi:MAG: S1C family serine protease [Polyangiales bacterium]
MSTRSMRWGWLVCALAVTSAAACKLPFGEAGERDGRAPIASATSSAINVGLTAPVAPTTIPIPQSTMPIPVGAPASFAPLARQAEPAVVTIVMKVKGRGGREMMRGLGTGFLIDRAGTIITNNHVVAEGNAIEVVLSNDKSVEGKIVGTDPMTDVAVVKIDPPAGIEPLRLGDSDEISVGDWVWAIGNPLGLSHTVTAGILSAKGRTVKDVPIRAKGGGDSYFDFLQTDCAINPGNSGGPLLNLKGEVVGMNTAINAAGQGLAFAIPINMIKQMIPSLVKEGHLVRAFLGVGIEDAPFGDKSGPRGAIVNRIWKGTPADKAGLKEGDHVLAIDGAPVRDSAQMRWLVSIAGVGKQVTLRLVREEKAMDVTAKLEELPTRAKVAAKPSEEDEDDDEDPPQLPFVPHRGGR